MSKIDSTGVYLGDITESVVNTTQNGFPQWVIKYKVAQKYVETKEELAHFSLPEPAYVDYSSFDYDDIAYLVLFNGDGALKNYEQAQAATGWDGIAFETLADAVGKRILVRVEENEYNGKKSLRANWVDAADASPNRTLKALDAADLKSLTAKFITKKPVVKAAKPGKPAATKPPTAPASTPAPVAAVAAAPSAGTTPTAPATKAPPTASKAPKAPPVVEPNPTPPGLPKECTMEEAWTYVCEHKGSNTDDVIQDAWIAAGQEVADGRKDEDMTPTDWAKVRNNVIKDCGLS